MAKWLAHPRRITEGTLSLPRCPGVVSREASTPENGHQKALHGTQGYGVTKQAKGVGPPRPTDKLRQKAMEHRCLLEGETPIPGSQPVAFIAGFEEGRAMRGRAGKPLGTKRRVDDPLIQTLTPRQEVSLPNGEGHARGGDLPLVIEEIGWGNKVR